jgi:peptidylprolyl isomerase
MKKRTPRPGSEQAAIPARPVAPELGPGAAPRRLSAWWGTLGVAALGLGLGLWLTRRQDPETDAAPAPTAAAQDADAGKKAPPVSPPKKQPAAVKKEPGDTLLDAFAAGGSSEREAEPPALSDEALEKQFQALLDMRVVMKGRGLSKEEKQQAEGRLNQALGDFETALRRARQARPQDAVPEWLTGELLLLIGGHPTEEVLPPLRRAVEHGLVRPRVFASLARVQTDANQPEEALRSAVRALDLDGQDRYAWNTFTRAAFNTERFAEVAARLRRAFLDGRPAWADEIHAAALDWQKRWEAEQKQRAADQKANLPRVRLLIEHRRFARDAEGKPLTAVESTGKGEVILELFEDQAPLAVANFLTLVEKKVYDSTRFHRAEPGRLVAGGDPKSRTGDPKDDGTGNPGYFIPDEFQRPDARGHFRGAISLVNNGPKTTGCQFFITLAPARELDGHFTVFGRVLKGQEVIDRITPGRTSLQAGPYGRIIPGDLLLRAEVLRKRPHEYRVVKLPQE